MPRNVEAIQGRNDVGSKLGRHEVRTIYKGDVMLDDMMGEIYQGEISRRDDVKAIPWKNDLSNTRMICSKS